MVFFLLTIHLMHNGINLVDSTLLLVVVQPLAKFQNK